MSAFPDTTSDEPSALTRSRRGPTWLARLVRDIICLLGSVSAFIAYEHFKVNGDPTLSFVSLIAAAILVLVPVRAQAAIDHSLSVMADNPLAAATVPPLRRRLAEVRNNIAHPTRPNP